MSSQNYLLTDSINVIVSEYTGGFEDFAEPMVFGINQRVIFITQLLRALLRDCQFTTKKAMRKAH